MNDESLASFMPLGIRRATAAEHSASSVQLRELIANRTEIRIAVLGNPGAGKTTLAKQLCLGLLESDEQNVPVFLELKRYHPDTRDVRALFERQTQGVLGERSAGAGSGVSVLVLDGLNEVADGLMNEAISDIEDFADSPDLQDTPIVVTCRTVDYPTMFTTSFARYSVVPVSETLAREYLADRLGARRAQTLWERMPKHMVSLCRSPLMLGMLAFILLDGEGTERDLPRNRSALYGTFLGRLEARSRENARVQTPEDIRESGLAFLAYQLQNERFEVPLRDLQAILTEFFEPSWQIPIGTFQREILDLPPMGAVGEQRPAAVASRSFMHQSIQEYYTAVRLKWALSAKSDVRIKLSDLAPYLAPGEVAWHETFGFLSGMLDDSTDLVRTARREGNLSLAALCVEHAGHVEAAQVDDFICRTLDEFKYGEAFDYRLIFLLQQVVDRRGPDFPARAVDDIGYWADRYSRFTPQELGAAVSHDELVALASGGSPHEGLDAVWTLGRRRAAGAVELLERLAQQVTADDSLREHSVVALGRISDPRSLPVLKHIAMSDGESRWLRSYALHAVGTYATAEAVEVLADYLERSDTAPFADDAAWALSGLADSHPELVGPELPRILRVLDGQADRYTKGCLLFVIGCGRFREAVGDVLRYLESETDPYILEDGCHALGALGDPAAVAFLARMADPARMSDAMVRRQALRSLLLVAGPGAPGLDAARHDPVPFVRDVVTGGGSPGERS
ncbi:NACHT domain-containing NTPase [Streptomyces sp. TS71-3]|uniref:NACHT domain-containing protein n=1 Tax=Streptomyces sp. TS71-3 TaxID=2733862 RepID=UPI001B08FB27|nr:HEAT repeat domain-containing protein [Streptomyces sp. TS71-3]GHJ39845.1 hypothetical protein Sm713_54540 [Streptomyces sp. TS71-3]